MTVWWQDIRLAMRSLARRPYLSLVIVATMAVGIGANVGAFAYYSYFSRPTLDAPGADRLYWLYSYQEDNQRAFFALRDWRELEEVRARIFDRDASWRFSQVSIQAPRQTLHSFGAAVSGSYFSLFGTRPHLGRLLGPEDDRPDAPPVMMLSYLTWARHFQSDPEIVGQAILVDGRTAFTVVGVTEPGFQGTGIWVGVYLPLATALPIVAHEAGEDWPVLGLGRLAPGITAEQAGETLAGASRGLDDARPLDQARSLWLQSVETPVLEDFEGEPIYQASKLLVVAVGMLLLLGCANVANLMLARGVARRRELGIHAALGAGRLRVARRLLLESTALSVTGGLLGLALARGFLRLIEFYLRQEIPVGMGDWGAGTTLTIDETGVGLFFAAVAIGTGLVFGVAPVFQMLRLDVVAALKGDTVAGDGRRWQARDLLVVAQVALSAMLLIGAALLARTLWKVGGKDLGFDDRGLMLATLYVPEQRPSQAEGKGTGARLFEHILERVESLPDVESASLAWRVPLGFVASQKSEAGGERSVTSYNVVSEGYFRTLGLALLSGRAFDSRDDADGTKVIVVNRTAAETYWPGEQALGQTLRFYPDGYEKPAEPWEVIGVVADSRFQVPWQPIDPHVYLPFAQKPYPRSTIVLRAASTVERSLRDLLRSEVPDIALVSLAPFEEQLSRSMLAQRMNAELAGGVGLLALLLASFGIFSVMSYTVTQRHRDIGIRVAIGATGRDVLQWVLGGALQRVATGLVIGLIGAALLSHLLESLLIGVDAHDPLTFAAVPVVLALGALFSAWLPARRATRIDPLEALRGS